MNIVQGGKGTPINNNMPSEDRQLSWGERKNKLIGLGRTNGKDWSHRISNVVTDKHVAVATNAWEYINRYETETNEFDKESMTAGYELAKERLKELIEELDGQYQQYLLKLEEEKRKEHEARKSIEHLWKEEGAPMLKVLDEVIDEMIRIDRSVKNNTGLIAPALQTLSKSLKAHEFVRGMK